MVKVQYKWFGKEDLSELEETLKEEEITVKRRSELEFDLGEERITTKFLIAKSDNLTVQYYPKEVWWVVEGELTEKDRRNLKIAKERYPHSRSIGEITRYGGLAGAGIGLVVEYLSLI